MKCLRNPENTIDTVSTADPTEAIIAAEGKGILIPLLQYTAAVRYMSILTINAMNNSLYKLKTPPKCCSDQYMLNRRGV